MSLRRRLLRTGVALGVATPAVFLPAPTATRSTVWAPTLLVPGYAGPLFRLRRASDNAELDYSASGGANPTTLAGQRPNYAAIDAWTGGVDPFITTIYDQTGSANHLTQVTTTKQPYLSTLHMSGGVRSIEFTSRFMDWPAAPVVNAMNCGVFFGVRPTTDVDQQVYFELYNVATKIAGMYTASSTGIFSGLPNTTHAIRPRGIPHAIGYTSSATARKAFLRETSASIAAATVGVTTSAGFIGKTSIGGVSYDGIYENYYYVLYTSTPDDTEAAAVNAALSSHYGFAVSGFTKRLVYGGSSLQQGVGATRNQTPSYRMALDASWEVFAMGDGGVTLATHYSLRASRESPLCVAGFDRLIVTIDAPSNDIAAATYASQAAAETAADTLFTGTTVPYVQAIHAFAGSPRVVVPTMISRTAITTANFKEYARLRYNANVRANTATYNYTLTDRCSYAPFDTTPTTANFIADLIHPNDTGYIQLAAVDKAAILAAAV